jgi:protein TonB
MMTLHPSPGHGAPLRGFFAPWRALPSTSLRLQMLRAISAGGGLWVLLFLAMWVTLASLGLDRDRSPVTRMPIPVSILPPENYQPLPEKPAGHPVVPSAQHEGTFHPVPLPDLLPPAEPAEPSTVPFDETGGAGTSPAAPIDLFKPADPLPAFGGVPVPHDVEPEELLMIKPEYPELAKQAGVDGTVWVALLVGTDGRVKDARVTRSASPLLDRAALEALRRWVFRPALASGHPVAVWVSETVKFTLHTVE